MSCSDIEIALEVSELVQDLLLQSPIYHCCVSLLILIFILLILMILTKAHFVSTVKEKMKSKVKNHQGIRPLLTS
nr:MAG: hypothetical protein [Jingmen bat rhabdovirus 3]WPV62821.1 MAG: hypothetical protein [Jingmen bat rhabdovirus 3]WPV62832.1 MAG: hypothetical protein [Jingmen bat rhabdovirus 3]